MTAFGDMKKLGNKEILVTGGLGFVGSRLVDALKEKDVKTIVLDRDEKADVNIDITRWDDLKNAFDWGGIDAIYHLAALTNVVESSQNPRDTYGVNVFGTLNVLELCRIHDIRKMFFMSSFYVYGRPEYLPVDENHPVKPTNPYSMSKYLAEQLCKSYNEDYGLRCTIVRPVNVYGVGQKSQTLFSTILNQMFNGKIELKDPEPKRDYVYVSDLIDALIKVGEYDNKSFDVFNVGCGESYSVRYIVEKLISLYGRDVEVRYLDERRKNEVMNVVADIQHIKDELGWHPKVGIDEGLKKMLDGYEK